LLEPLVNIPVDCVISIAKFLWSYPLLPGSGFRSGAVLVGSTDVEGLVALLPTEPGEHVGRQDLSQVSKMRNIIYIRECRGYKPFFHRRFTIPVGSLGVKIGSRDQKIPKKTPKYRINAHKSGTITRKE